MNEIIGLPAFDDNYIWVWRQNGKAVAVDPGDAAPVLAHLKATGDELVAVLITHHHGDHCGGIADLAARVPGLTVYGPAVENIDGVTHPLTGNERLHLAEIDLHLDVLSVPGHTRGHLAYVSDEALFCGDTLFGAGCGRLFEGTPVQMQASLARIAALPAPTFVYCAHEYTQSNLRFALAVEPENAATQDRRDRVAALRAERRPSVPSTLNEELATNPFLRWDAPDVIAAATRRLGHSPASPVETFAAIREWRNGFR